jgi:hypothetical protein
MGAPSWVARAFSALGLPQSFRPDAGTKSAASFEKARGSTRRSTLLVKGGVYQHHHFSPKRSPFQGTRS